MNKKRYFDFNDIVGWEKTNPYRGIYKIKCFFRNLKWAWQRFCRGYDDRMIWCLNDYIKQYLVTGLRIYVQNNISCYPKPRHLWKDKNVIEYYTGSETENLLRKMIKHILLSDEEVVEKFLYGSQWDEVSDTTEEWRKQYNFMKSNYNKAFDLLRQHYGHLWQ